MGRDVGAGGSATGSGPTGSGPTGSGATGSTSTFALRRGWIALSLLILAAILPAGSSRATAPVFGYKVINVYPHDQQSFIEGLVKHDGTFYEGTGLYTCTSLRKVAIETGQILKQYDPPASYFGEGVTALGDSIYQLTYQEHAAFTFVERDSFELVRTSYYPWEGWGLTTDSVRLIASDGTSTLRFLDPVSHAEISHIQVRDGGVPVRWMNELEWAQGQVYANIWGSDTVAVIQPETGDVRAWLDLSGLRDSVSYYWNAEVLNGIAFDPLTRHLYVTGKFWPKLFEISVPTLDPTAVDAGGFAGAGAPLELRVTPQPCGNRALIDLASVPSGPVSLGLYDTRGALVRAFPTVEGGGGRHLLPVDLSELPCGTYFLTMSSRSSGESRMTHKILVVR
jgi:glutaminyl-peptide cyclotransferase